MNLLKIAGRIRRIANEVAGNHHSPEETESLLLNIADELDDIAINTADIMARATTDVVYGKMGISQENYERWTRQLNLEKMITKKRGQK